jgi:cytochrome P450
MADGEFLTWLARHGVVRVVLKFAASRGEVQARLATDRTIRANPFPVYQGLRRKGPVHKGRATYLVSHHESVSAVLRSDDFKVGLDSAAVPWFMKRALVRRPGDRTIGPVDPPSLLAVNPPDHTRYRKLVHKVFTPRAVAALEPRVQEIANELLDDLQGRGVVNLVDAYASLLPVTVIAEILGVPLDRRDDFLRWGNAAAPSLDIGLTLREYRVVESGLRSINDWMYQHIERLRRDPGDDMLSRIIQTPTDDGTLLDDTEVMAIAGLVLAAGFETTVNLIGSGVHLLLTHPEQLARLRAEPDLWANAVDEVLRYEAPVQNTARFASRDTEVCGVPIPNRAFVAVLIGSGNRDEAVFTDGETFDVARPNARDHLAFSAGYHYCIGAALARAEGRIALQTLFERFPDLALAGRPTRRPTRTLRGFETMPVLLGQARVPVPAQA